MKYSKHLFAIPWHGLAVLLLISTATNAQNLTSVRIGESQLDILAPTPFSYTDGNQFTTVANSVSGSASGPVTAVALSLSDPSSSTSGCDPAHFNAFPSGNIALIQRGGCTFAVKVSNAQAAGASGVILFDQGLTNHFTIPNLDLGDASASTIPVLASSFAFGEFWAGIDGLEMHLSTQLFRGSRAEALLRYCAAFPDHCALSVRHVNGGWERHLNPDRLHVTASTYKTLSLIAYAEAVVAGQINPAELIDRDEWARYSVGFDAGALANVWTRLGEPSQVTVDEMMRGMMRESDNAAPDWLLSELGVAAFESVVANYVAGYHDVPISINAFFNLFNGNIDEPGPGARILAQYNSLQDPGFRQELTDLFNGPMQDSTWMQNQRDFLCTAPPWSTPPSPCSYGGQNSAAERSALLGRYFTRTTSRSMLELMTGLLGRSLLPSAVQAVVEPHVEWGLALPAIGEDFSRYGSKGGSFAPQNICNSTAYAENDNTGDQIVVSLFIHNSRHGCGIGLFPDNFIQTLTLDADFRELLRDDPLFDLIFKSRFEAAAPP